MMEQVERDNLQECVFETICALNHLMQDAKVCVNDRHVIKINKFKKWVMDLGDKLAKSDEQDTEI